MPKTQEIKTMSKDHALMRRIFTPLKQKSGTKEQKWSRLRTTNRWSNFVSKMMTAKVSRLVSPKVLSMVTNHLGCLAATMAMPQTLSSSRSTITYLLWAAKSFHLPLTTIRWSRDQKFISTSISWTTSISGGSLTVTAHFRQKSIWTLSLDGKVKARFPSWFIGPLLIELNSQEPLPMP